MCDVAEYYGIYDMESFKPSYIGTLVAGLRDDSRTMMELNHSKPLNQIIAAYTADQTATAAWLLSKDGQTGENRPKSMLSIILGEKNEPKTAGYDTPEEFFKAMEKYK